MRDYDLEALVGALRSAVETAQKSAERRHHELLHQLVQSEPDGTVRSKTLALSLPARAGDADAYEAVEMPLLALVDRRSARIAELSLEFDCELHEVRPEGEPGTGRLVVTFHALDVLHRNRHRVKISIFGGDALRSEVRRDGILIREIGLQGDS